MKILGRGMQVIKMTATPIVAGVLAYMLLPHKHWDDIDEGLLAFLGLICAGLVQIIPTTINFVQPEHVTPSQARAFNRGLEKLQDYWLGLLVATMAAGLTVIVGRLLIGHASFAVPPILSELLPDRLELAQWISGIMAAAVSFVADRAITVIPLVRRLQRQRSEIVLEAAARLESDRQKTQTPPLPDITPPNYGDIVRH